MRLDDSARGVRTALPAEADDLGLSPGMVHTDWRWAFIPLLSNRYTSKHRVYVDVSSKYLNVVARVL